MLFVTADDKQRRIKTERLYHLYRAGMYKAAYGILHEKHLAEDAVHESFIRILKNLHKINEIDCPQTRSFVVIICRNVAKNMLRERLYLNNSEDLCEELSDGGAQNPEGIVLSRETLAEMEKAIEELPEIYRDTLLMKRAHGMSNEEIAEAFGITAEAVKKRLTRARQMVMEKLRREDYNE